MSAPDFVFNENMVEQREIQIPEVYEKPEQGYYTLDKILKCNADYNLIYGERSNGKTTAVFKYALKNFIKSGYVEQLGLVRRYEEDYKGKNGDNIFTGIVNLGWVDKFSKGKYNNIVYARQRWWLCYIDDEGKKLYTCEKPFAIGFAIGSQEHYKSTSYPDITTILFDEFLTRSYYLPNEFVEFQNLLSTIIRLRNNVKIFMCGNTVNKYCPYFAEMGISNITKQEKDTIDLYTYGDTNLKVAVEYSISKFKTKISNKYFAFNNPKLKMIRDGEWEIDIYPHLPCKYLPKNIQYTYYLEFNENILTARIINVDGNYFTYIHRKTTPIREDNTNIVFSEHQNYKPNYRRNITKVYDKYGDVIYKFFKMEKVFYQDNEVGEIVRNYLIWCVKNA